MFCPFCGTVVEGGAQFCPNCGQQLPRSVDAGPIPTGGTIIDATVPDGTVVDGAMTGGTMPLGNQDFGTIPVQVPPVDSAPSAARPNKPGLDKGVWGIVIASVVVIALIIGGTIAFLHVGKRGQCQAGRADTDGINIEEAGHAIVERWEQRRKNDGIR